MQTNHEDEIEAQLRAMEEEFPEAFRPPWACGKTAGEYVMGAQLPTRDGRRTGNAHIIWIAEGCLGTGQAIYHILTDAGNSLQLSLNELAELFYPPQWVSDVDEIHRKFGPR